MSAALLGLAFSAEAPSASAKLILLKLVDCCDDAGKKIFPSVATLARAGQCSDRQVQRVLRLFCDVGLLYRVRDGGAGAGNTACYEMSLPTLRAMAERGWAAVSGRAPEQDGDDAGDGPSHAENAEAEGAEPEAPEAGRVTRCHPYPDPRVTSATNKGDKLCHPTPQTEPSRLRESAGGPAGAGMPAGAGAAEPPAMQPEQATGPVLDDFRKAWPTAAFDGQAQIETEWAALPFHERRAAMDGIAGYLAAAKAQGRKNMPSGGNYLKNRLWTLVPAMRTEVVHGEALTVAAWSRDWWALFLTRMARGEPVASMFSLACQSRGYGTTRGAVTAARADLLRSIPSDGEAGKAWAGWLRDRGHRLPWSRTEQVWMWVPDETPGDFRHD